MKFSIIICTYNPNLIIFNKLINSILRINNLSPGNEVIIVDNNSTNSLEKFSNIQNLSNLDIKVIKEDKPGLTSARIAGIKITKYEWIVFFDDDNEPEPDYIIKATSAINKYLKVGAWGPGNINVVYSDNADEWLETKKDLFQQRNEIITSFAGTKNWQSCYPFGTGMIINRKIAFEYADRVESGRYTLTDRKGKSLSSGGDVQLVLTAIDIGYEAGTIAGMSLNHLIDSSKANLSYLVKQQYGTASAYVNAYNQVFIKDKLDVGKVSNLSIIKKIYTLYRVNYYGLKKEDFSLLVSKRMGEMNAAVSAKGSLKPLLLKIYEKIIR